MLDPPPRTRKSCYATLHPEYNFESHTRDGRACKSSPFQAIDYCCYTHVYTTARGSSPRASAQHAQLVKVTNTSVVHLVNALKPVQTHIDMTQRVLTKTFTLRAGDSQNKTIRRNARSLASSTFKFDLMDGKNAFLFTSYHPLLLLSLFLSPLRAHTHHLLYFPPRGPSRFSLFALRR